MKLTFSQTFRVCVLAALIAPLAADALAQRREDLPDFLFNPAYQSSRTYEKKAVMDGNEVAITFFNYGLLGGIGEVRGNWPKGSDDFYVGDVQPVIVMEVPVDLNGDARPDTLVRHAVTNRSPRAGQNGPPGNSSVFWGFEAKPGFASNRVREDTGERNEKVALSTDPATWPDVWPDQPTWINPATGRVDWNGFFGRGIRNADLETYFWTDDQNNLELFNRYGFIPDSTDKSRRGTGLAMKVRGLQWSQFLAQDAIFWLYEVTNTSTVTYPRVAVGLTVGTLAGGDGDSQDDLAFFDQNNRIVYSYDFDNSGNQRQPVGYAGYGFLESPGDARNGIDDDGDGDPFTELGRDIAGRAYVDARLVGTGNVFTQADFLPRTLNPGDPIVLIDDETMARTIIYMGNSPMTVVSQGITYNLTPGMTLEEKKVLLRGQIETVEVTEKNLIDEDLDGLIDEDVNLHFERRAQEFSGGIKVLPALRYKDYVGFARATQGRTATEQDSLDAGLLNPMIDEARDDGIDNDNDWSATTDDVGADGVAGTGDRGEGDGVPTAGEPNFDALDVDESDQVGLTSFFYFTPPGGIRMSDDERLWEAMSPGFFTTNAELQAQQSGGGVDGDFIFSSGYFRLEPGETVRFTMAMVFGNDLPDITNNAQTIQEIYDRNYQFARPPERPTLRAVPGDKRVTLYWDSEAEESIDPILGRDFEGYRIYKSTDPFFKDPAVITDATGNAALMKPFQQFDLNNNIEGFWPAYATPDYSGAATAQDSIEVLNRYIDSISRLTGRVRGTSFFVGENTGLRHAFVDTLVDNGRRYYYAITAYDRGNADFFPAENNIAVSVSEDGTVITGTNVVEVIPNAPVLGYEAGRLDAPVSQSSGAATGDVFVEVLDPRELQEGARYTIVFDGGSALAATNFRVVNAQGQTVVDTTPLGRSESIVFDGLRATFRNDRVRLNPDSTGYATPVEGRITLFVQSPFNVSQWRYSGQVVPFDYQIRFGEAGTSLGGFQLGTRGPNATAVSTTFSIFNTTLNRPASFVFFEPAASQNGSFDAVGELIFIYEEVEGVQQPVVAIRFDGTGTFPQAGARYNISTYKPFSPRDQYTFTVRGAQVNQDTAREQLDRIRAVPNPYVVSANWERSLPPTITSGRGERRMDFTHLPKGSTVRIYTVRGELLRELHHDGADDDGTVSWDLRTRENLEVAYGVYFYHVQAPGVGEKQGKLAIIK